MSGNHPSELSPRQRMINMMYLVLTALLALNVSKEVLNSFFSVNLGIVRATESVDDKNKAIYDDFENAANKEKVKPYKELANKIMPEASDLDVFMQRMKYSLVLKVDKRVFLGSEDGFKDEDGKIIQDMGIELEWDALTPEQQKMTIGELNVKDDRNTSDDIFNPENKPGKPNIDGKGLASQLREKVENYGIFLSDLLITAEDANLIEKGSSNSIKFEIDKTLKFHDNYGKKKNESWEYYNFHDMPAVAALTILSKLQADVKTMESEVIAFLATNIDASSLKFSSAQAVTIPSSNFVLKGDDFRSKIFLTAFDKTISPEIYIGDYDSVPDSNRVNNFKYSMKGNYDDITTSVVEGQGIYTTKGNSAGPKSYSGLIKILQNDEYEYYPFHGSYTVTNKHISVSPVAMNVMFVKVNNPVSVSVAGFQPSDITVSMTNGSIRKGKIEVNGKKVNGYIANPTSSKNKSIVTVYVKNKGKKIKMGNLEFRVEDVPPPKIKIDGKEKGFLSKAKILGAGGLVARLEDFYLKGIRYSVISYEFSTTYEGNQVNIQIKGAKFNNNVKSSIKQTSSGNKVTFSNIKARRTDAKGLKAVDCSPVVFKIK